jgi:hypothetical protein
MTHRPASLATLGLLLIAGAATPLRSSTLLTEYSGSYSILALDPASEPVVSLRLTLAPQFADCSIAGACVNLALLAGLDGGDAGTVHQLNNAAEVGEVFFNGSEELFWFSMNFGSSYSATGGGGTGIYESVFTGFPLPDIDSITLTVDRLLFRVAPSPFGPAAEATLEYTLSVYGAGAVAESEVAASNAPPSFLIVETPEPATWLLMVCGLAGAWGVSRRL